MTADSKKSAVIFLCTRYHKSLIDRVFSFGNIKKVSYKNKSTSGKHKKVQWKQKVQIDDKRQYDI